MAFHYRHGNKVPSGKGGSATVNSNYSTLQGNSRAEGRNGIKVDKTRKSEETRKSGFMVR